MNNNAFFMPRMAEADTPWWFAPQQQTDSLSMGQQQPFGIPNAGGTDGFKFGWNMPTAQLGMQGLNTIGNLWGAWQANKLAKDQLNFTKNFANRNLANQTKAYNTALEDRGRARAYVEGQSSSEAQAYIDRNRLDG